MPEGHPQPRNTGPPKARPVRTSKAAQRLECRAHGAKRSAQTRNTAQALAQGGANVEDRAAAGGVRTCPKGIRNPGTLGRQRRASANIEGRAAAGAPRTRSEAKSAGAEHRASVSAARCEPGGREAAGAPRTRSEAESAGAEHRASVSAGAHEGRALCAKQAEVSPMKQGVPQASL